MLDEPTDSRIRTHRMVREWKAKSSRRARSWVWPFPLFAALFLQPSLAAGQQSLLPQQCNLPPDVLTRLAEAAKHSTLAPWQQKFMLDVARGGAKGAAASPALPRLALPSAGPAADDGGWIGVPPVPPGREGHTAIYDPVRDRMVVFGGTGNYDFFNDVWALTLSGNPAWSELSPAGTTPLSSDGYTAIYDPVRDRMLVYGGNGGSTVVWELSLSGSPAWSELVAPGGPSGAPYMHTAIYDPVRDRMLVFGGFDGNVLLDDVWELTLSGSPAWTELAPTGTPPSPRYKHTAIYDPVRDRMVVFGGHDGTDLNDVWGLTLSGSLTWAELAPSGSPPAVRFAHTAIYDPVRDRMLVFAGNYGKRDVWELTLSGSPAWSELAPGGTLPSGRFGHTAIYDPVRDRMVAFGGYHNLGGWRNDVRALTLAGSPAWSALAPSGGPPAVRAEHAALHDPVRDRMLMFGGDAGGPRLNDVWALTLSGSPAWTELAPTGTPPSARDAHTAIYDPVRDRMVVFGGHNGTPLNDVWALTLSGSPSWSSLTPTGILPAARYDHTAVYDPVRDRMVVFGGRDGSGLLLNDVWALTLTASPAWSELAPTGTLPSGRFGHTAIYDPMRDRMVVFGGNHDGGWHDDVWGLMLSGSPAWGEFAPGGTLPAGRQGPTAIYDPARDRMVVFGGNTFGVGWRNDVWALSLAGSPAWSELSPQGSLPNKRLKHTAIYDPVGDRMVVFAGSGESGLRGDVWALGWGPTVSVPWHPSALPRRFELAPPRPNPSRGETLLDFELGEAARVALDVFDAHGRRVRRIADGWFTAGRHASMWRGDDDRGQALGSGVYFILMQGDGFQARRRAVQIR